MSHKKDLIQDLNLTITKCRRCPRLVEWRQRVAKEKVKRFSDQTYWGKPVPGFGDPKARLLIVGLAPAAHGANRTGRMFTGDRSGEWLYRTLHKFGFSNSETSVSSNDGLILKDCYITAIARCAPPQNKLLTEEIINCRPYLIEELFILSEVRIIVALGKLSFDSTIDALEETGKAHFIKRPRFTHGASIRVNDRLILLASYHPSQQNTFTGKLTRPMFDSVFRSAKLRLASPGSF